MSSKRLLVVVGPTGSGKTDLSIRLARYYAAPVLSTDSRQVYRGMPIGTAQPSVDQLQAAEHHFIASHDIKDNLSCGEYEVQALERLGKLFADHDYVVAVGGNSIPSITKSWTAVIRRVSCGRWRFASKPDAPTPNSVPGNDVPGRSES